MRIGQSSLVRVHLKTAFLKQIGAVKHLEIEMMSDVYVIVYQVWGISENRDKSYHSNARPRLTLAALPSLVSYPTTASLF